MGDAGEKFGDRGEKFGDVGEKFGDLGEKKFGENGEKPRGPVVVPFDHLSLINSRNMSSRNLSISRR